MRPRLIFVYNANAGLMAGILDSVHKTLSPGTYPCSLCAITYGAVSMKPRWRAWLKAQSFEAVFHHRPDFQAAYPDQTFALPAILIDRDGRLDLVMGPEAIAATGDVDGLIAALAACLAQREA